MRTADKTLSKVKSELDDKIIIKNGIEFERLDDRNYAIRPEGEESFVDDLGDKYYAHVYYDGEQWASSAVYDGETNPEDMPVYIEMCKEIEAELEGGAEEAPADFELSNTDTDAWTPTQFLEKDPFHTESLSRIVLCVDWENKTATVETRLGDGSYPVREHNGLDSSYTIPDTTDFSQFPAYFSEHIRPALEDMSKKFESHWDGSNWVGRFDFKEAPEDLGTELYLKNEHLGDLIREAPQSETLAYFDVGDSFQAYSDIIDVLENEGIDFMVANLKDLETVKKIREALEDEVVYIMDDEEFALDLLRMRESIQEEEAE